MKWPWEMRAEGLSDENRALIFSVCTDGFAHALINKANNRTLEALLNAARKAGSQAREDAQPVEVEPVRGEVDDEWADKFCEAVNWSPDGQECRTVEGVMRCVTFRDLAKGYILSAIATQPGVSHPAPDALRAAMEALEPFAAHPDFHAGDDWPVTFVNDEERAPGVTAGDFRRARQALAALQAEQKGGA